ncbi:glycosyltransferase family 2 protein [Pseudoalteromonas sp. APC 3355]|uniref:glycosyltransferase family 2 protein n=1 Tax=Pseudoalteromonas sp. APC 3355 TaxID=3035199 RepID=UPI0025B3577D|nr:glycosyltransferase family 2 protein [Pseudoalteromonas sp. APC 3355]MDN3475544.1 glycosyltransferase family 2 protein [Pseudoalteromonas sp. APC 3355]
MNKSYPKISVILCVYNGEKYIIDCLESISQQTYDDYEVIIINDGSSDKTLHLIESYYANKSESVTVVNQSNQGLTKSLNIAISISKGEYIARVDADDICHKFRFEKSIQFIESKKLDFITTRAERFTSTKSQGVVPNYIKLKSGIIEFLFLRYGNPFVHGTFFGKKRIFTLLKYDESYRTAQDFDFLCRLLKNKMFKVGYLNEVTYYLRILENSLGRAKGSTQRDNALAIARKHFGTDKYMIIKYGTIPRLILSFHKRLFS